MSDNKMTPEEVMSFIMAAGSFGGVPFEEVAKARAAVAELVNEVERLKGEGETLLTNFINACVERDALRRRVEELEKARSALELTLIDIRDETGNEEAALAAADAVKTWGTT